MLEHFDLDEARLFLNEVNRVLKSDGVFALLQF